MPMIDAVLMELEQETRSTRRLMERLPADKLSWRPHRKSYSLGQLALHITTIAPGVAALAERDATEPPNFQQAEAKSKQEVLESLDRGLSEARERLGRFEDAAMMAPWSLKQNGKTLMTLPRAAMIRTFMLNQHYHHRGQLTVYLRELDVPLPPVYGPTADEPAF